PAQGERTIIRKLLSEKNLRHNILRIYNSQSLHSKHLWILMRSPCDRDGLSLHRNGERHLNSIGHEGDFDYRGRAWGVGLDEGHAVGRCQFDTGERQLRFPGVQLAVPALVDELPLQTES